VNVRELFQWNCVCSRQTDEDCGACLKRGDQLIEFNDFRYERKVRNSTVTS